VLLQHHERRGVIPAAQGVAGIFGGVASIGHEVYTGSGPFPRSRTSPIVAGEVKGVTPSQQFFHCGHKHSAVPSVRVEGYCVHMSLHRATDSSSSTTREEGRPLDCASSCTRSVTRTRKWDEERNGVVRSMRLLADETSAFTREVRGEAAAQLQVISTTSRRDHHRRRDGPHRS